MKEIKLPKIEVLPSGARRIRKMVKGEMIQVVADTDEEVLALYLTERKLIEQGLKPKPQKSEKLTLEQAIDRHIARLSVGGSPSTARGYEIIKRNAFQHLMKMDIRKITKEQWQKAVDDETAVKKLAPKTVYNRWSLCQTVLRENKIEPPELFLPDHEQSKDDTEGNIQFLDDEQLKVFCKAIRGSKYELPCYLALNSLRCSEIYGMTYDRIDTKSRKITVYGAVVPDKDNKMVKRDNQNKNRTSKRTVPILFPRIIELVDEADKTKKIIRCTPNWFYKYIKKVCADNGLPEMGIHALRHTGASLCIYRGVNFTQLMRWFGWSNPDTPRKIYIHMSDRQKNLEADKVFSFSENS